MHEWAKVGAKWAWGAVVGDNSTRLREWCCSIPASCHAVLELPAVRGPDVTGEEATAHVMVLAGWSSHFDQLRSDSLVMREGKLDASRR